MPSAVSNRYAAALADAVLDPKAGLDAGAIRQQLTDAASLVRTSPELNNVLLSPAVPASRKRAVVERLAASLEFSKLVRNFLFVLIDRRRTALLDDIRQAFEAELDTRSGLVRAQVSSAAPLDEAQQRSLEATLARLTGREVRAQFAVDPSLIGGAVARIGSTIYDGSVRGKLNELRTRLTT